MLYHLGRIEKIRFHTCRDDLEISKFHDIPGLVVNVCHAAKLGAMLVSYRQQMEHLSIDSCIDINKQRLV